LGSLCLARGTHRLARRPLSGACTVAGFDRHVLKLLQGDALQELLDAVLMG
jgi:hypothetical protein